MNFSPYLIYISNLVHECSIWSAQRLSSLEARDWRSPSSQWLRIDLTRAKEETHVKNRLWGAVQKVVEE